MAENANNLSVGAKKLLQNCRELISWIPSIDVTISRLVGTTHVSLVAKKVYHVCAVASATHPEDAAFSFLLSSAGFGAHIQCPGHPRRFCLGGRLWPLGPSNGLIPKRASDSF